MALRFQSGFGRWPSLAAPSTIVMALIATPVCAQFGGTGSSVGGAPRSVGTGVSGSSSRSSGLSQTGNVSSDAAIQRNSQGFVGASSQSMTTIGSLSGSTGTSGLRTTGGLSGLSSLSGFGGMSGLSGLSGMGGRGMSSFGGMGGMNMMGQGGMNSRGGTQKTVRAPLRLAPEVTMSTAPSVSAQQFESRLARLPRFQKVNGLSVSTDGPTVVLRGVVATDHDRDVLGRLALLEPGIDAVRNELQVDPSAAPR